VASIAAVLIATSAAVTWEGDVITASGASVPPLLLGWGPGREPGWEPD
jgi:hypothetical protein